MATATADNTTQAIRNRPEARAMATGALVFLLELVLEHQEQSDSAGVSPCKHPPRAPAARSRAARGRGDTSSSLPPASGAYRPGEQRLWQ